MSGHRFGLLNPTREDRTAEDFFAGSSSSSSASLASAAPASVAASGRRTSAETPSASATSTLSQRRAASHSVQFTSGVASSLATLTASLASSHSRRSSNVILQPTAVRAKLPALTEPGKHVFVLLRKRGAPKVVSLWLSGDSIVIAPWVAPPPSSSSPSPALALASASPSSAVTLTPSASSLAPPTGAASPPRSKRGSASNVPASASCATLVPNAAASSGLAGMLSGLTLSTAAGPSHSVSPPPSVPSSPSSKDRPLPDPIAFASVHSVSRGFKSKRLQALAPPAEVEQAAFTLAYTDGSEGDAEAKKHYVHLVALSSRSRDLVAGVLETLVSSPTLAAALSRAQEIAFENAGGGDVNFHSLLARHYSHLTLPAATASSGTMLSPAASDAPVMPSRRNSLFHGEYVATRGFTMAPSERGHSRAQTASNETLGAFAEAGLGDLLSPHPVTARDVLPSLLRGAWFLKFGREGAPKFRFFILSADCLTLVPYERESDIGKKMPSKAIDIRMIDRIILGHASARFLQAGVSAALSPLSFSLHLRMDGINKAAASKELGPALIACTLNDFHIWSRGLVHLTRALDEHDQQLLSAAAAAGAASAASAAAPSSQWPPPSLLLDIPVPLEGDASDLELTDFTLVKGVESSWRALQRDWAAKAEFDAENVRGGQLH